MGGSVSSLLDPRGRGVSCSLCSSSPSPRSRRYRPRGTPLRDACVRWRKLTRKVIIVPDGYQTPDFPSLYLPSFVNTRSEIGVFLYEAESAYSH